ncbi:MAG: hypothetical protein HYV52_02350 [Parcubacteria group bacterium]|nr:hypothetical protein [Parcubacteria group bacterium]
MLQGKPNPGSNEAIQQGCACPVLDNRYGAGAWFIGKEIFFYIDQSCPIHKEELNWPKNSDNPIKNTNQF